MKSAVKRVIVVILGIAFVFLSVSADKDEENPPKAFLLMEAETRSVLEGENTDMRLNSGYLAKLMGILLVAEDISSGKYDMSEELTASDSVQGTRGSVVWLESGDRMTVEELLKSVIIGNANDAMTVLAERSAGSTDAFVMNMNAKAFDLGLRDTFYSSPYGYPEQNDYTTAHDIAVICSELAGYDFILPFFSTWRDFVKNGQVELVSENTLARTYERHIGFKAAHSDETGFCIAEGGRKESGTTFISVVLGAENEDSSFGTAKKLLKNGFNGYKVMLTMFTDEMLKTINVKNGTETAVELMIASQGKAAVPKASGELRTRVVIPEYLSAPVREGQPVGTAAFYNDKTLVFETDIVTKTGVDKLEPYYVLKRVLLKMIER